MEKLTQDQLSMFDLMTCENLPNAISSQESQGGAMLSGSPGGQMTGKFGRVVAHVSHSQSRDRAKALTMTGIYGQTFFDSLEAVAHKSSWVSRLQARLGIVGSTESDLIWKAKITPAKALIYRLAPQTRRTSDKDYSGSLWTTPRVSDKNTESRDAAMKELTRSTNGGKKKLALDVHYATWPTPKAIDGNMGFSNQQMAMKEMNRPGAGANLPTTVSATWPTPKAGDGEFSSPRTTGRPVEKSTHLQTIAQVMMGQHTMMDIGATQSGSTAPMVKRGALNPEFVCWLMGFPPEWESCAPTEMPSSRKSRQR
jgi:hypothetical protein